MFNHSCDPSIVRFYVEDVVAVQAIKNIRKGEEICENYGPIFFHSSREDRQVSNQSKPAALGLSSRFCLFLFISFSCKFFLDWLHRSWSMANQPVELSSKILTKP